MRVTCSRRLPKDPAPFSLLCRLWGIHASVTAAESKLVACSVCKDEATCYQLRLEVDKQRARRARVAVRVLKFMRERGADSGAVDIVAAFAGEL